jgi:hypothetical protein
MISDLVKNHLNSNMNKTAIIDILGKPADGYGEIIEKDEFGYEIYEDYGCDIDPVKVQYLTISFDKD